MDTIPEIKMEFRKQTLMKIITIEAIIEDRKTDDDKLRFKHMINVLVFGKSVLSVVLRSYGMGFYSYKNKEL